MLHCSSSSMCALSRSQQIKATTTVLRNCHCHLNYEKTTCTVEDFLHISSGTRPLGTVQQELAEEAAAEAVPALPHLQMEMAEVPEVAEAGAGSLRVQAEVEEEANMEAPGRASGSVPSGARKDVLNCRIATLFGVADKLFMLPNLLLPVSLRGAWTCSGVSSSTPANAAASAL